MHTISVGELKNRLNRYLRLVRSGERVLISDGGEVVAELRPPDSPASCGTGIEALVHRGIARPGLGNSPALYPRMPPLLAEGEARRLLDLERGSR